MLTLFNTLSGRQEPFESIEPKHVRMYVCGVTVYDYCHIGHARSALVFDVLRRYLEYSGYQVDFVKNFTDVDDKIIKRANEQRVSCDTITNKYIEAYYEDMGKLGIGKPTEEPKATEHMADIIAMTETLIKNGLAYTIDGDVYFQVDKYPAYGRLSKRKMEDLQAGARVDVDERKRHPMDFALWKSSKPGEPSWPSPWGAGRPGWHIECSAMSIKHLGETFDIHGGGMDLIFPHHENEIAQSCGATGKEFARYWVHNGFVQINQEKMSKSLGNFFTIREIFEKEKKQWPEEVVGEMLRYFLLSTHYRGPLDFSDQSVKEAKNGLDGFYDLFKRLGEAESRTAADQGLKESVERCRIAFREAMDDDLNTPMAIAALQILRSDVNKSLEEGLSTESRKLARDQFRSLGKILGLFELNNWRFNPAQVVVDVADVISVTEDAMTKVRRKDHPAYGTHSYDTPLPLKDESERIQSMVDERNEARKRKDFKRADDIRAQLASLGITIEDKPDGTSRWKR